MSSSGAERIAPVTWLFGSEPAESALVEAELVGADATSPEEPRPPLDREAPVEPGRFEPISNVSMHALARRGVGAEEMASYLVGRGFDEGEVELECERLLGVGLLDDLALAQTLVRTLRERKGLGRSFIAAELRRRRLDPGAIEEAMGELDDDELERAVAIAENRARQLRSLDAATAKRRLGAFLMRKGYSGSVVSTAVARALAPAGGPVFR